MASSLMSLLKPMNSFLSKGTSIGHLSVETMIRNYETELRSTDPELIQTYRKIIQYIKLNKPVGLSSIETNLLCEAFDNKNLSEVDKLLNVSHDTKQRGAGKANNVSVLSVNDFKKKELRVVEAVVQGNTYIENSTNQAPEHISTSISIDSLEDNDSNVLDTSKFDFFVNYNKTLIEHENFFEKVVVHHKMKLASFTSMLDYLENLGNVENILSLARVVITNRKVSTDEKVTDSLIAELCNIFVNSDPRKELKVNKNLKLTLVL